VGMKKAQTGNGTVHKTKSPDGKFSRLLQDPLGSVVAASAATIGSFGVVIGGIWAISLAVG